MILVHHLPNGNNNNTFLPIFWGHQPELFFSIQLYQEPFHHLYKISNCYFKTLLLKDPCCVGRQVLTATSTALSKLVESLVYTGISYEQNNRTEFCPSYPQLEAILTYTLISHLISFLPYQKSK